MTREELLQIAKPILFNAEMVRAILNGRETATRRLVKFPVNRFTGKIPKTDNVSFMQLRSDKANFHEEPFYGFDVKVPYKTGDILYVRETWNTKCSNCEMECPAVCNAPRYVYKANCPDTEDSWKPSIHMPKEAARIFLKVKDVRVERLQEITEDGAVSEGIYPANCRNCTSKMCDACPDEGYDEIDSFVEIWNSTIKKSDLATYGWEANPWVFVYEFERVEVDV